MMSTARPPTAAPIIAVLEVPCTWTAGSEGGALDVELAIAVAVLPVTCEPPGLTCCDSVDVGFADEVEKVTVGVWMGRVYDAVLARSLITDAESMVNTLESSLQQVLPSESQQYRSPPHVTSLS
jgi:hypothetical protein